MAVTWAHPCNAHFVPGVYLFTGIAMRSTTKILSLAARMFLVFVACVSVRSVARAEATPQPPNPQQAPAQTAAKQVLGAIQAIQGGTITLRPDTGPAINVVVQGSVRILRVAP